MLTYTYYFNCTEGDSSKLDDNAIGLQLLHDIASMHGLTVVAEAQHQFQPQGISIALVLSESHIALHTWPEEGNAYLLLSSCKQVDTANLAKNCDLIQQTFACREVSAKELA